MGKLKIIPTPLSGAVVIDTQSFEDHRGAFSRFFCKNELSEILGDRSIVNVNFSRTTQKGALRGMHYQNDPHREMKMVRCLRGAIYDVIVDIRKDSPTFLNWFGVELTPENQKMLVVPEGFAHGFQALEDDSEILYLTTSYYSPECEAGLRNDDPALAIEWPLPVIDLSAKDRAHPLLSTNYQGI